MDFPIKSYKLFWDTERGRGGVTVGLQRGAAIPLLTDRAEVMKLWTQILLTDRAIYYVRDGAQGIATAWSEGSEADPGLRWESRGRAPGQEPK